MGESETAQDFDFLTIDEARQALHIGVSTLWRLIAKGDVAVVRIAGRTFIERDELRRLVAARRERAGTVRSP